MAVLSDDEVAAIGEGNCEPDERSFRVYIAMMLSQIAASTAAAGGGTSFDEIHTETVVDVGAVSTPILPAYADRKKGWIRNISGGDVWIHLDGPAVVGQPSYLANEEVYNLPPLYTGPVTGIRQAGVGVFNVEAVDY